MHTHDKTMLASLGFADVDKKEPLHDLAARYLTTADRPSKIIGAVYGSVIQKFREDAIEFDVINRVASVEVPLVKGLGHYRSMVGFLDATLEAILYPKNLEKPQEKMQAVRIAIEVKISPIGVGDILRQIGLYREFMVSHKRWVLATAFAMTAGDMETLRRADVGHVFLGDTFRAWAADQQTAPTSERMITV